MAVIAQSLPNISKDRILDRLRALRSSNDPEIQSRAIEASLLCSALKPSGLLEIIKDTPCDLVRGVSLLLLAKNKLTRDALSECKAIYSLVEWKQSVFDGAYSVSKTAAFLTLIQEGKIGSKAMLQELTPLLREEQFSFQGMRWPLDLLLKEIEKGSHEFAEVFSLHAAEIYGCGFKNDLMTALFNKKDLYKEAIRIILGENSEALFALSSTELTSATAQMLDAPKARFDGAERVFGLDSRHSVFLQSADSHLVRSALDLMVESLNGVPGVSSKLEYYRLHSVRWSDASVSTARADYDSGSEEDLGKVSAQG